MYASCTSVHLISISKHAVAAAKQFIEDGDSVRPGLSKLILFNTSSSTCSEPSLQLDDVLYAIKNNIDRSKSASTLSKSFKTTVDN